jgi:hypothetical protein
MAVTEVTHTSWFSRLGSSLKGILLGFLLFGVGVWLMAWNEGRAVKTAKGLKEGASTVMAVDSAQPDPANEGRLVHLTGVATSPEWLKDDLFPIEVQALKLRRQADMFQWRENTSSQTRNKVGGGTETVTTYDYERVWADKVIPSNDFKEPNGHRNPSVMPVTSPLRLAKEIIVGGFKLGPGLMAQVGQFEPLPLPAELPEGWTALDGKAFKAADPSSPQVGDLRVQFSIAPPVEVSLIAVQRGGKLEPYLTQTGTTIELLAHGSQTAAEMFEQAVAANTLMTWLLRLGGFLLLFIAVRVILAPLAVLADVLPFLGSLLRFGTSLIAGLIAIPTAFITIAVSWIAYRPTLAIALLAVAVIIPVMLVLMRRPKQVEPPPVPSSAD